MGIPKKKARKIFKAIPLDHFRICINGDSDRELTKSDLEEIDESASIPC